MKVIIKSLVVIVLLFGCNNSNNVKKNELIVFDLKKITEINHVLLSDLGFADIEYIPLETTKESILPHIDELLFMAYNRIVAEDNCFIIKHLNLILKFSDDGSFVCRIGTQGRGPDEFTLADDIDVNPKSGNIYLACAMQKKIYVYSANGKLIRSFQLPINLFAPVKFRFADDKILCYNDNLQGNVKNSFILLDTSGTIIKNFPNKYPFNKHKSGVAYDMVENIFYRFNNKLSIKEMYSDTIYFYNNMEFKPKLVIGVGEKLITPKARTELDGLGIARKYINPLNIFEFGDFVFYTFIYESVLFGVSREYGFLGSQKNKYKAVIDLNEGLINDLDGGPNILPLTTKDDNTVIALISPLKLKSHVATDEFKNSKPKLFQKKKELEELADRLRDTDNPVLVLLKIKN